MSPDPLVGQVLDGRYRIEALIGEGGMGRVYRALHLELHAPRAIKVMRSELAKDAAFVARFETEARLAEGLRHPNLVTVHDLGRLGDGTPYIVSELVEGETLSELFRQGLTFTPEETCEWLCQLAAGLSLAHRRGIVHRDIAPDNIMVTGRGGDEVTVRLLDFGIAKRPHANSDPETGSSVFLGKLGYAAPEQMGALPERNPLDGRTDIFSLTAVAYQMLTGGLPWKRDTLQAYVHDLLMRPEPILLETIRASTPSRWSELLERGLARDREQRLPDMEAFAAEIREAIAPEATEAALPPPQDKRPPGATDAHRARRGLAGVALAVAVAATLALYWLGPESPASTPPSVAERATLQRLPPTTSPSAAAEQPSPVEPGLPGRAATTETMSSPEPDPIAAPSASTRRARSTPIASPPPSARPPPSPTPSPSREPATVVSAAAPTEAVAVSTLPATLRITSTPEAEVQLDGVLLGRTPRSIRSLESGPHELLLRTDDGRTHREQLELAPGTTQGFDHRFPGYGSLSLVSASWAIVRVDDGPELETPVRIERLAVGEHVVEASRPGYQTRRIPIEIGEGRSHTLVIDLERER